MRKPKFPMKLDGIILIYTDGGNPSVRVFKTREALVTWVGSWHLEVGRSDSHWIDGVVTGQLDLIDESIRVYFDEDAGTGAESQNQDQPGEPAQGDEELDGRGDVVISSSSPDVDLGVP